MFGTYATKMGINDFYEKHAIFDRAPLYLIPSFNALIFILNQWRTQNFSDGGRVGLPERRWVQSTATHIVHFPKQNSPCLTYFYSIGITKAVSDILVFFKYSFITRIFSKKLALLWAKGLLLLLLTNFGHQGVGRRLPIMHAPVL